MVGNFIYSQLKGQYLLFFRCLFYCFIQISLISQYRWYHSYFSIPIIRGIKRSQSSWTLHVLTCFSAYFQAISIALYFKIIDTFVSARAWLFIFIFNFFSQYNSTFIKDHGIRLIIGTIYDYVDPMIETMESTLI